MQLELRRIFKAEEYTIGRLYIDGNYFCDTLEDAARAPGVKIAGKTAIPAGTYKIILNYSHRFKRILPLLLGVPMFSGIRIHAGNTAEDTEGCILVGKNTQKGKVLESKVTFEKLFKILFVAVENGPSPEPGRVGRTGGETLEITIK